MKLFQRWANLPKSVRNLGSKFNQLAAQINHATAKTDIEQANIRAQLDNILNVYQNIQTEKHDIRLAAIETASLAKQRNISKPARTPSEIKSLPHWSESLSINYPELFPLWQKLYNAALPFYSESIEASCSTWENKFAMGFRDYLNIFADGYLLDVGSGILKRPVYLEGFPADLLRGIDPREVDEKAEFKILVGVNEFLPWKNDSFQTVCNATSLDHVIDMNKSLDETARVLSTGGKFVIWYAHVNGAPPPPKTPIAGDDGEPRGTDEFHIFHINDDWFMPMLNDRFTLIDRRIFDLGGFSHVFACYEKS